MFAHYPHGDWNQRFADAGAMDTEAVVHAKQRPVGGAEDVLSLEAEKLIGHPIEHPAGMGAAVFKGT